MVRVWTRRAPILAVQGHTAYNWMIAAAPLRGLPAGSGAKVFDQAVGRRDMPALNRRVAAQSLRHVGNHNTLDAIDH
jgi:hypothetical protein